MTTFDASQQIFSDFPWLKEVPELAQMIIDLTIQGIPSASVTSMVRQSEAYKTRFPGMALRESRGYNPIDEMTYLRLEDSYRSQLREAQVLNFFADSEGSFRKLAADLVGGDVSAAEMSRRIDKGYAAVADAGPIIKETFGQFYGYQPDDAALLLYFLDPDRGTTEIENQVAAVQVGASAYEYGLNITRTRAELLRDRGVTQAIARQGFADVAREEPLFQRLATIHSITPLSQTDLENFFFHEDPGVTKRRKQTFDLALSQFQAGSFGAGVASPLNQRGGLTELLDARRTV